MPSPQTTSRIFPTPPIQTIGGRPRRVQLSDDDKATARVPAATFVQGERLLRLRDVLAIVGLSRAHVYNLIKQELFPRPIALGSNCARWVQSEVQAWVLSSIQAARSAPEELFSPRRPAGR
jgi:prophage regulatory protein